MLCLFARIHRLVSPPGLNQEDQLAKYAATVALHAKGLDDAGSKLITAPTG